MPSHSEYDELIQKNETNLWSQATLNTTITITPLELGNDIKETIIKRLKTFEGTCVYSGYIKPNSIQLINYGNGIAFAEYITFSVNYSALIANPSPGTLLYATITSNNIAAIHLTLLSSNANENKNIGAYVIRDTVINSVNTNQNNLVVGSVVEIKVLTCIAFINTENIQLCVTITDDNIGNKQVEKRRRYNSDLN